MKATKAQVEALAEWMHETHQKNRKSKGIRIPYYDAPDKVKDCYRFVAREILERPPDCLTVPAPSGAAATGEGVK